jgi:TolA-binding protein
MKKALRCWVVTALILSSCSLLQRNTDELEDDSAPPFDPAESSQSIDTESEGAAAPTSSIESEVSRLNTKISALETKLDVLTASVERNQLRRTQPIIEAQAEPQPNMAAPVEESSEEEPTIQTSAAPTRPAALPVAVKSSEKPSAGSEREFQSAMELFQEGKNLEAASRFALFAKKYPRHLMASHALYWAGEASARSQQWSLAMENWEELEKLYPRSAYMPEALAGLARAYENQGNTAKANSYRNALLRGFPKSPTALSLQVAHSAAEPAAISHSPAPSADEDIPSFEDSAGEEGQE